MGNLIRDVAVISCGTHKAPHALDITKMHDICHRVVQLRDDLGMSEHFKAVIGAGFNVIDPLPLLAARLVPQKRFRSAPGLQIQ